MKKQNFKQSKLKFEKFNVSKLSNLNSIKGGGGGGETTDPPQGGSTMKCLRH